MTKEHLETGPSSIRDDSICEPSLNPNKSSGDIGERLRDYNAFSDVGPRVVQAQLLEESAAEIERLRRIEAAHQQQIIDAGEIMKYWQSRALTAESAVAAAMERAAKIEADTREKCAMFIEQRPGSIPDRQEIASAIRAAVSKKTAESGHSPSTRECD